MLGYLEKFNKLPQSLRDKVSSPLVVRNINNLENKYNIDIAITVMKVMTKDIPFKNLVSHFTDEFNISKDKSQKLVNELTEKVFNNVKEHLSISGNISEIKNFSDFDPNFPQRQTVNKESPVKNSSYLFSPEDEEEIRELAKKIDGYSEANNNNNQEKIDDIVKKIGINFGASYLEQRFRDIISTYIRGIRDRIDTRITLGKTLDGGGLGLDSEAIDKVLMIADNSLETEKLKNASISKTSSPEIEKEAKGEKIDIMKNIRARDVDYNLKKVLEEKENKSSISERQKSKNGLTEKLDLSHELAPPSPEIVKKNNIETTSKDIQINKGIKVDEKVGIEKNKIKPSTPSTIEEKNSFFALKKNKPDKDRDLNKMEYIQLKNNIPSSSSGKKIMKDVSVVPRVMSPTDELRYMDLVTFRRLGQSPGQIVEKINSKIKLLEEDNYSKRAEGIKAWRNSPVNRLYLSIGEESIGSNKPINAIIKTRKAQGKDYLDENEFEAIMDLNKDLRF